MTKILFIITQGEMGGAQRYVLDLAKNLDKTAFQILVAMGAEKPELEKKLTAIQVPIRLVRSLKRDVHPLADLRAIQELKKIITEYDPAIIHLNSSKAGVLGSIAGKLAGQKNIVFTAHGFAFLEPHAYLIQKLYFWAEKLASRYREKIITVSEFDRRAAIKRRLTRPEKFVTIHNGIDLGSAEKPHRQRPDLEKLAGQKIAPGDIVVGSIAHDYATKDLKTLRTAFALANKQLPSLKLMIIGKGSEIGAIPAASDYLVTFDIFALSSSKEGFPYTILEAMRAGLPIVATAVGGIPEAIEDQKNGLLVPSKNPDALAAALLRLATDKNLADTLGRNARERVKDFSLEKMLSETKMVYAALLKKT